jgi:predicted  nucleic acid-binding Zn-ribbon protein
MTDQKCAICGRELQPSERYVWRGKLYCGTDLPTFQWEEKPSSDKLVRQLVEEMDKVGIAISDKWGRRHSWKDEYVIDHLKTILLKLRILP